MNALDYAAVHGPSTGDRVRLGDTGLVVEVEADSQRLGDELIVGFGKTGRDGLHFQAVTIAESCDLVISNVLVLDAVLGIRKVSIGVTDGRITGIGRAGNPDTLDGVDVVRVSVTNTADVPVSITSHFHFFEANPRLHFVRAAAYGRRLAIPAGAAVRFDPGATIDVELTPIIGNRVVIGGAGLVDGPLDAPGARAAALALAASRGYLGAETPA